ncbi:sll0787 family AIR synthase-like protein [Agaribacter marinus]|uniref:Methanogenesis marker 2 protein n=1 Tax=Agaribacter marinus TaxID=1431249 RepID=A0AA37SY61_9ALTE|nr:sll0787 family AIR synthase-like protein [Agaribacter marinus]GLR71227.1 methanogenesis marker 2 protein [Agaribacter marinus]
MQLNTLLTELREYSGIQNKKDIAAIKGLIKNAYRHFDHPNGDDTAAIKTSTGYDLFATEGFLSAFVAQDPWFAGWCGVMVNVSDVAAMGGHPTAIVNTIWAQAGERTNAIYDGMVAASQVYQVPIVGGHTNLHTQDTHLCVSILGKAKRLLSSFDAKPNDELVVAIDLRGEFRAPFLNWNAATNAPPERLRADLALLPQIAENNIASAAKDISQAGILGTCTMLLESSGVGAEIELENIPKPAHVNWHDWLRAFPSYGYVFACNSDNADTLVATFAQRGISAAKVGTVTNTPSINIHADGQSCQFWNIEEEHLTDMTIKNNALHIREQHYA